MNESMRYFLRGLGSILVVWPRTDYERLIPSKNDTEAIGSDWKAVGEDLAWAMARVRDEQRPESQTAAR